MAFNQFYNIRKYEVSGKEDNTELFCSLSFLIEFDRLQGNIPSQEGNTPSMESARAPYFEVLKKGKSHFFERLKSRRLLARKTPLL